MPLPKPTLDNRGYDQLVGEGRNQIPRRAPAWTDHNASDPGITLLELAAWLTEQQMYRLDRPSPAAIRRFARLVGAEPQPPGCARTVVGLDDVPPGGVSLPARLQLHDADGVARFETVQAIFAAEAKLVALAHLGRKGAVTDLGAALAGNETDPPRLAPLAPLGARPHSGDAFYLGFDRPLDAAGQTLSLHLWTPDWQADADTRVRLIAEAAARTSSRPPHCPPAAADDWRQHYRTRTVWEFYAGNGLWQALADVVDETRALSLTGFVRFAAPAGHRDGGLASAPALFALRCRLQAGGYECAPRLLRAAFNAVEAEHALSRPERPLGTSAGHAGARFAFGDSPIVTDSVTLRLDDGAGQSDTGWRTCLDRDASGAHDREVLLDPEAGWLESGDGLRGATLPAGFDVYATFRVGGGSAGNLAARALRSLPASPLNRARAPALAADLAAFQPLPATDGRPRESLDALRARAAGLIGAVDKAVTLADFERLARATPGVPVARARAIAGLAPELPCYPAPGRVTVVVVPACRLPAPMPSRELLERVRAYLEPRRLATCEVTTIAPRYRRVGVGARLHVQAGEDTEAIRAQAMAAIDAFFDPLSGGPEGTGWPIGRPIYRSEVMALLAALPGVTRVTGLGLRTGRCDASSDCPCGCSGDCSHECNCDGDGECHALRNAGDRSDAAGSDSGDAAARCDNVNLCAHELPRPGRHEFVVESPVPTDLQRSDAHECPIR